MQVWRIEDVASRSNLNATLNQRYDVLACEEFVAYKGTLIHLS